MVAACEGRLDQSRTNPNCGSILMPQRRCRAGRQSQKAAERAVQAESTNWYTWRMGQSAARPSPMGPPHLGMMPPGSRGAPYPAGTAFCERGAIGRSGDLHLCGWELLEGRVVVEGGLWVHIMKQRWYISLQMSGISSRDPGEASRLVQSRNQQLSRKGCCDTSRSAFMPPKPLLHSIQGQSTSSEGKNGPSNDCRGAPGAPLSGRSSPGTGFWCVACVGAPHGGAQRARGLGRQQGGSKRALARASLLLALNPSNIGGCIWRSTIPRPIFPACRSQPQHGHRLLQDPNPGDVRPLHSC